MQSSKISGSCVALATGCYSKMKNILIAINWVVMTAINIAGSIRVWLLKIATGNRKGNNQLVATAKASATSQSGGGISIVTASDEQKQQGAN